MRLLLSCLLPFFLLACTAPQPQVKQEPVPVAEAPAGALALVSLLQTTGREVSVAALQEGWPETATQAEANMAVTNAARRQGRLVYPLAPEREALLAALEQGHPVLAAQAQGLLARSGFTVLTGVDLPQAHFLLSPASETLPFAEFDRRWARAGHWAALVLDPARLPDTLEPPVVVRELVGMAELGARTDAQAGLARAVLNWPAYKPGWIALASVAQENGDMALAESSLRELVRRQPGYGPGLNNLADLLHRTGREQEALAYAERAVTLLDIPQTRALLSAIHAALREQQPSEQP